MKRIEKVNVLQKKKKKAQKLTEKDRKGRLKNIYTIFIFSNYLYFNLYIYIIYLHITLDYHLKNGMDSKKKIITNNNIIILVD